MLPSEDDAFYAALVARLSAASGPRVLRSVRAGTSHITHAFLGDVGDANVGAITNVLRNAVTSMAAVDVVFGRPEVLGGGRGPRALLVPVVGGRQALFDRQVELTLALRRVPVLASLALPKPPHVTIARFSRTVTRHDAARVSQPLADMSIVDRSLRVDRVQLLRSTLSSTGSQYDELLSVAMGGASAG